MVSLNSPRANDEILVITQLFHDTSSTGINLNFILKKDFLSEKTVLYKFDKLSFLFHKKEIRGNFTFCEDFCEMNNGVLASTHSTGKESERNWYSTELRWKLIFWRKDKACLKGAL